MKNLHINSFKSVRIEMLAIETKASLGFASGYLISYLNKIYLVSNWHVFTGKNTFDKSIIHNSGTTPGHFKLSFFVAIEKTSKTLKSASWKSYPISLYERKNGIGEDSIYDYEKPIWIEHPKNKEIDVSLLDITHCIPISISSTIQSFDLQKELDKQDINLGVMDDIFIVGYPLPTSLTPNEYPIYKNATVATEPNIFRELPIFYIDGKTKKGMSGSPVIKKQPVKILNKNNQISFSGDRIDLVGTYSGRERNEDDLYTAELGIVWHTNKTILEIINQD